MNLQKDNEKKTAIERYPLSRLPLVESIRTATQDLWKHITSETNRQWIDDDSFTKTQDNYNGRTRND